MTSIFKLFNSYFFKTIYGPVLSFVFPPILLVIMGNILRLEYVFPGIVALISIFIAIQALPLGLMEMKRSTLFSYIGVSPIKTRLFTLSVILYYIFIIIISIILLMIVGIAAFYDKIYPLDTGLYSGIFSVVGFFSFLVANIFHIFLSLSIGIAISSFSKTPQQALTISLIIIIPSMFLSGMVISVDIIAKSETMQIISRCIPFRYTTGNIVISSTPQPQLGSILDKLNRDEIKMIFSEDIADSFDYKNKTFVYEGQTINIDAIIATFKHNEDKFKIGEIKEQQWKGFKDIWFNSGESILFRNIFMSNDGNLPPNSDNNIFNLFENWGVRRIPDIDDIKLFVSDYLGGDNKSGGDPSRLISIYDKYIRYNNFSWLNVFLNQNIILYKVYDRILNFVIPISLSSFLFLTTLRNFKFSSR